MGEQKVSILSDEKQMQRFVKSLLEDVEALSFMLDHDWFESDVVRIGAEQEMVLVDSKTYKPATKAMEALEMMKEYPWVETELAKFNIEINLEPHLFEGKCLSALENETLEKLHKIQKVVHSLDTHVILTGILPTMRKFDLSMENLTPKKRYFALMEAINQQLIGNAYELRIAGIDELILKHDSPLLEAVNTSFQVHLQVSPKDFVKQYNLSQALAAPVMAIAANSPIVFGRRLWHESRIAMFQQALDTRASHEHMRQRSPRVSFGNDWLQDSILEIYRDDIARFRVLLSADVEEEAMALLRENKVPKLRSLQVHNSTVYRWNRPCYGISENGKPHLRIENRVIPSGPTVLDEVANAAFWLGTMVGLSAQLEDIRDHISFDDVRDNFIKAAQYGIDSKFTWFDDEKLTAVALIKHKLLPIAREGLRMQKVDEADIDRYLDVIQKRADLHTNGARWALRTYTKLKKQTTEDEALSVLTCATIEKQADNQPVHTWTEPELHDLKEYRPGQLKVSEFMSTDLITVQKDDIIQLVAEMMDWRKIRYTPVEDQKGKLIGLVSSRNLLRHFLKKDRHEGKAPVSVMDIMISDPITIGPDATIQDAMEKMRKHGVGCLPVVNNQDLIGVITEMDFLRISGRLIERMGKAKP